MTEHTNAGDAKPTFTAVIDEVPAVSHEFVVCLGRPATRPPLGAGRMLVFDEVTEESLDLIHQLDPRLMAGGLIVMTTRQEHARRPREVLRAQKALVYLYTKHIELPLYSTRIPDTLGLRSGNTPPEYLHQLNLYRNTPLHLRHCLADKLDHKRVGMPCLILLPGPSLTLLKGRLPELARRYLIVTISRALPFLRACGVEPDVLLQLDTVPLLEHFHHPAERFPHTVLLALSMAPISSFAPRFRQLFFMDSFNLTVLSNPARIRESWLSSLLACLGCVEILHAPKVLLAGSDLRLIGQKTYHDEMGEEAFAAMPAYDAPLTNSGHILTFPDHQGRQASSTLQYFATAAEAELFAREIHAALGTTFHCLSPWSLLDPEIYARLSVEEALQAPELDKDRFLAKADAAADAAEHIKLHSLRAIYSREAKAAQRDLDIFACLQFSAADTIQQHPCYRYIAANVPWFRPTGEDNLRRLAGNLAKEHSDAARFARNVAALHLQAARDEPVPVLCTSEEEAETRLQLARLWPDWSWRCLGIDVPGTGRPAPSGGGLELHALHDWLHFKDVVIVAPGFAREFHYALSLIEGDNSIGLWELTPYANVAFESGSH
jgi:spore maturation protein SpmB